MKKSFEKKTKFSLSSIPMHIVLLILAIITLVPFISIFLASLRPGTEIMRQGIGLNIDTSNMSMYNYKYLFTDGRYFTWFFNSILVTIIQTALTLLVSAFVGYGFAMYNFKFKNALFICVLFIMMVPLEIIMLPLYQLIMKIGLINSYWGVILPSIAAPLPIFFFRQYLGGIPKDFLDAARVDGCNEYRIFFKIIMPLMKPSFAAMGIFVGMNSWNNYLWPMIVLNDKDKLTLPIGLGSLLTPYGNNYDLLISGAVFSIVPIIILFLIFQKNFIAGLTAGGVKG